MKKSFKKHFSLVAATLTLGSTFVVPLAPVVSAQEVKLETTVDDQEAQAIEGGTLKVAQVGSPFEGILNSLVYSGNPDNQIISLFNEGLFGYDADFVIDDTGFGKLTLDKENKQATITIPEGHKWDDGEPITIDDVIFPYYVVGHKDYTGVRYGDDFKNIVGMEEYHEGKADTISGLERVDDYTLRVTYKNFPSSMPLVSGGVSNYIEPEHVFKDIEVKDFDSSEPVRKKPVGFGPFKVESVTPGEAVTFVANEHHWRGKPKVDALVLEVLAPETAPEEMKAGKYDIALTFPTDTYDTYKDATNFKPLGRLQNAVSYVGFKLGKWNEEKGEVEMDDTKVLSNKALRQAMAYAANNAAVGEKFYHGLRTAANSLITPNFTEVYNSELEGYSYDPEKAKALLEEAGFKDGDNDGFVEAPDGKPFTLKLASMSGGEIAEPLAQFYLESWKAVGINVELTDGRLLEFNAFYDRVEKDDPEIDVYIGAWGLGGDPAPNGLYARDAKFNYTRFATPEHDALLEKFTSDESFDPEFRKQAFAEWQRYMHEEVPAFPTLYRYGVTAVNNRVNKFSIDPNSPFEFWHTVELTADAPIAE
ncbi:oligopeptide ABC transporter substrate-binding protein [Aerococcaceae bacterium NML191219]|nr:oligopeptide ABC transporter substrate-binding protein [Aerococcaceae bacterium NML191219]